MDASDIGDRDTLGKLLRTTKRLARELSRIDTVFNAIQSAIVVTDKLGTIQFANNYAMRVLGLGNSAQSIFKVLPGIDGAFAEMEDSDALMRREFEISYPEYRLLSAQIIPFDFGGGRNTFAVILNDITQEKRSTEEKIESEKLASVINLASGIAHELGNPLNSINIHLQLVRRKLAKLKKSDKIDADLLSAIEDSVCVCSSEVSRLDAIIENFLKAMRPMRADLHECDPLKPLAETLKVLNGELLNLNITVLVNTDTALPTVCGDENLLKQLYFNILKNAIEAMSDGGRLSISATSDDDFVKLEFSDTGCGMDEEGISNLFQPHYTTKPDGHGLGMTIIQAIVRAHDGKIDVKSAKGEGTTITVSIPRKQRRVRMLGY